MIRLVIAEDETVVRTMLARLLAMEDDIEVVGTAPDGETALKVVRHQRPDVLLTDLQMPEKDGIALTQTLKTEMPDLAIVVLTVFREDAKVFDAIKAGALGYVLKDSPPEETVAAIRAASRGEALMSPPVAARVMQEFARISGQRAADLKVFSELTEREREVLKLVAEGKRNREIGEALFITEKTVKNHISSILAKLHANDRTEAAMFAARQGLVDLNRLGGS
ncbi:MAG: response regulator transcription factor [Armatimonadetes bacterium]|nr:response regulator transcription factor [Armatimonadota bacterium]